jgi:hypothetical protein
LADEGGAGEAPAVSPPSAMNSAPVLKLDSSLAENSVSLAISTGLAKRLSGACSVRKVCPPVIGVSGCQGETELTRT